MTVDLYMHWRTPYNPAVAGLTVEAWEDSLFSHSPVGNPSAYPPASSPTATTTTDSSGNCELTGLTADTNYYVSIIDENNKPWFVFCPSTALGNLSTTRRQFSIVQGPVAAGPPALNFFAAELISGIVGGPGGFEGDVPGVAASISPMILTGTGWTYQGAVTQPPILRAAGKNLHVNAASTLQLPEFAAGGAGWNLAWTLYLVDGTGANAVFIVAIVSLDITTGEILSPAFPTASFINQVGTDIVVPISSSSPITTTAGGIYGGYVGVELNGPGALA